MQGLKEIAVTTNVDSGEFQSQGSVLGALCSMATGNTIGGETTQRYKPESDTVLESDIKIAKYNPEDQLSVADLDVLYPEWETEHPDADPELLLFDFIRTMEERRIASERGISRHFATEGVEKAIERIPDEVGCRFQGHGIAGKYGSSSTELDLLLRNGIERERTFYTTSLRNNPAAGGALGADMPFTEGGLVVVGDIDKHLIDGGIKYVIVGEQYLRAFDVMKERYPDYAFIPWHDASEYFCAVVNGIEGTSYRPKAMEYAESYEPPVESFFDTQSDTTVPSVASYAPEGDEPKPFVW